MLVYNIKDIKTDGVAWCLKERLSELLNSTHFCRMLRGSSILVLFQQSQFIFNHLLKSNKSTHVEMMT